MHLDAERAADIIGDDANLMLFQPEMLGEAVCAVVAKSRAEAEDACALVEVDYEVLPAVTDPETALDAKTPVIHPELGDNLTFERLLNAGDPD
ncbi:carbon-monoxide dehydrogenase large subunit, partial [Rhodoplanes sp. JGI PP 4-B12]|uniref:hypothetical protein n=1 Tax=Rhodoplanes sp. JGI PP 4-B12 TaxID=1873883 RepID=UPI000B6F39BF